MTAVPPAVFVPTGFQLPAAVDVLNGVMADMDAACGGGMNLDQLENPLGQMASSFTAIISDKNDQIASLVDQVDPAFAADRMQDAIARIYFISRFPAVATAVPVVCSGAEGVVIPVGSRIKGVDGQYYASVVAGTIVGGNVTITFNNASTGPIPCGVGNLTTALGAQIATTVSGWDSVANTAEGTLGNNVESRTQFEARRALSVAKNALGTLAAVRGNILAVSGVLDAYVVENVLPTPQTISGVLVPPNSLYVSVIGGDPNVIARAIWLRKSVGCGTGGNTTVQVSDPSYDAPAPSYPISFEVPTSVPLLVAVTIEDGPGVPTNALQLVQNAIVAAFAGADGGARAKLGQRLLASKFVDPLEDIGAWVQVVSVTFGVASPTLLSLQLPINQVLTIEPNNITLVFG